MDPPEQVEAETPTATKASAPAPPPFTPVPLSTALEEYSGDNLSLLRIPPLATPAPEAGEEQISRTPAARATRSALRT